MLRKADIYHLTIYRQSFPTTILNYIHIIRFGELVTVNFIARISFEIPFKIKLYCKLFFTIEVNDYLSKLVNLGLCFVLLENLVVYTKLVFFQIFVISKSLPKAQLADKCYRALQSNLSSTLPLISDLFVESWSVQLLIFSLSQEKCCNIL